MQKGLLQSVQLRGDGTRVRSRSRRPEDKKESHRFDVEQIGWSAVCPSERAWQEVADQKGIKIGVLRKFCQKHLRGQEGHWVPVSGMVQIDVLLGDAALEPALCGLTQNILVKFLANERAGTAEQPGPRRFYIGRDHDHRGAGSDLFACVTVGGQVYVHPPAGVRKAIAAHLGTFGLKPPCAWSEAKAKNLQDRKIQFDEAGGVVGEEPAGSHRRQRPASSSGRQEAERERQAERGRGDRGRASSKGGKGKGFGKSKDKGRDDRRQHSREEFRHTERSAREMGSRR